MTDITETPEIVGELTTEEWRYVSVLIAQDIRRDYSIGGRERICDRHHITWKKVQPNCRWED